MDKQDKRNSLHAPEGRDGDTEVVGLGELIGSGLILDTYFGNKAK